MESPTHKANLDAQINARRIINEHVVRLNDPRLLRIVPALVAALSPHLAYIGPKPPKSEKLAAAISTREFEVLTLMARGLENSKIGIELHLSEDTIKTHARRLFHKLGARNRTEAVVAALKNGIIEWP